MTKLHELLASQPNLRTQAETCRQDLKNTFEKKVNHFFKRLVTFKSIKDGEPDKVEEQLGLQTTVAKELQWISEKMIASIDSGHSIDMANTQARADVILDDGAILLKSVPVTSLMALLKRVNEVQELVKAIPTLDPSKGFELDKDEDVGIFKARDVTRSRTQKTFEWVVMVPPTDKHPAQVKELNVDKPVGNIITQEWCSMITVGDKANMLDRIEVLIRALKKAASRGNDMEVDPKANRIGKTLLDYIFLNSKK